MMTSLLYSTSISQSLGSRHNRFVACFKGVRPIEETVLFVLALAKFDTKCLQIRQNLERIDKRLPGKQYTVKSIVLACILCSKSLSSGTIVVITSFCLQQSVYSYRRSVHVHCYICFIVSNELFLSVYYFFIYHRKLISKSFVLRFIFL